MQGPSLKSGNTNDKLVTFVRMKEPKKQPADPRVELAKPDPRDLLKPAQLTEASTPPSNANQDLKLTDSSLTRHAHIAASAQKPEGLVKSFIKNVAEIFKIAA